MDENLDTVLEKCLAVCDARSPHDAIAVALHACLLADGFACIATGDENFGEGIAYHSPASSPSKPTQSSPYCLPAGWNSSPDVYALQYHHPKQRKLCLVKMIVIEKQLLISTMSADDMQTVHSTTLETDRYLKSQQFNSISAYSNLLQLVSTLNKDIVAKLSQSSSAPSSSSHSLSTSTTSSTATTSSAGRVSSDRGPRGDYDPLRVGPPRHPGMSSANPLGMPAPFGYGDMDRFPFGSGGGGGMVFDPFRGGGRGGMGGGLGGGLGGHEPFGPFPSHGYVPGARWDPVTPFGMGSGLPGRGGGRPGRQHGEPDPDHLPPPGSDDMFS